MLRKNRELYDSIVKMISTSKAPYIDAIDICTFLCNGNHKQLSVVKKIYRAKKHKAIKIVNELLKQNRIYIDNEYLKSLKIK